MKLIFNVADGSEIIATILVPNIKDSWQAIDFCANFYKIWKKPDEEIMNTKTYEYLSHDLRLRVRQCCFLCGGYQNTLDINFMHEFFPKVNEQKMTEVSNFSPCVFINPSLIKVAQANDDDMRIVVSVADKKIYFFNIFKVFNSIEDLNLFLPSSLKEYEILECPIQISNNYIQIEDVEKLDDWIYYDLDGFDLDNIPGNETWIFKKNNLFYKLIG